MYLKFWALMMRARVRAYARLHYLRHGDDDCEAGRYDYEHANAEQHHEYGNVSVPVLAEA